MADPQDFDARELMACAGGACGARGRVTLVNTGPVAGTPRARTSSGKHVSRAAFGCSSGFGRNVLKDVKASRDSEKLLGGRVSVLFGIYVRFRNFCQCFADWSSRVDTSEASEWQRVNCS